MDITDTVIRQLVIFGDERDLLRIPPNCRRYFLKVLTFMEESETLSDLPDGLLYDPRREAVYSETAQDLARGVLACLRRLGRSMDSREAHVLRLIAESPS